MLYLKLKEDIPNQNIYIKTGKSVSVGRKGCDVTISNDSSISRQHCLLETSSNEEILSLKITDTSKYGTFFMKNGNTEFSKVVGTECLEIGATVRFGVLKSIYVVFEQRFDVSFSKLDSQSVKLLSQHANDLDGQIKSAVSKQTTFLVLKEVILNAKVVKALALNIPLVTPAFLQTCVYAVKTNNRDLPSAKEYLPKIGDDQIKNSNFSLHQNLNRTTLFKHKTFVFLCAKHFQRMSEACLYAGANTMLANDSKFDLSMIEIENTLIVGRSLDDDSLVVSDDEFQEIQQYLSHYNLRFLQECEIGLALSYCKIDVYCNPRVKLSLNGSLPAAGEAVQGSYDDATATNETSLKQKDESYLFDLSTDSFCEEKQLPKRSSTKQTEEYFSGKSEMMPNAVETEHRKKRKMQDSINPFYDQDSHKMSVDEENTVPIESNQCAIVKQEFDENTEYPQDSYLDNDDLWCCGSQSEQKPCGLPNPNFETTSQSKNLMKETSGICVKKEVVIDSSQWNTMPVKSIQNPSLQTGDLHFLSLIVSPREQTARSKNNKVVKNFKRFKKVPPKFWKTQVAMEVQHSTDSPNIIGGCDLYNHINRVKTHNIAAGWLTES